jgi:hypothetical protein
VRPIDVTSTGAGARAGPQATARRRRARRRPAAIERRYSRPVGNAYADLLFEPDPFTAGSVVRYFLDRAPEVVDAVRAAGGAFVMMPERRDFDESVPVVERARVELARAEELARDLAAWPIYVGTSSLSAYLPWLDGADRRGPPLALTPARGALAGYVLMGEGGAMFYAADGRLGHSVMARDWVLELARRRPEPPVPPPPRG